MAKRKNFPNHVKARQEEAVVRQQAFEQLTLSEKLSKVELRSGSGSAEVAKLKKQLAAASG